MAANGPLSPLRTREIASGITIPARRLEEEVWRRRKERDSLVLLADPRSRAESQFQEFLLACASDELPSPAAQQFACRLLASRGIEYEHLEFASEPDGGLGFDWILNRHQLLSVGIDGSSELVFVWRNGFARGRGRCRFDGYTFPHELRLVLRMLEGR